MQTGRGDESVTELLWEVSLREYCLVEDNLICFTEEPLSKLKQRIQLRSEHCEDGAHCGSCHCV